jgi:hypothetical protein
MEQSQNLNIADRDRLVAELSQTSSGMEGTSSN